MKLVRAFLILGVFVNQLLAARAAALDIDLTQIATIRFSAGNNPVTISTAAVSIASLFSEPSCQLTFNFTMSNGVLAIATSDPDQSCPLSIVVPAEFPDVQIDSSNGNIAFSGTVGQLGITGDNGTATITNSSLNSLLLTNTNGAISLDTVSANSASIDSTNGAVTITKLTSPFAITATNNKVHITSSTVPRRSKSTIKTTNANVHVQGLKVKPALRSKRARLKLRTRTTNGQVTVRRKKLSNRGRTLASLLGKGKVRATVSIVTVNGDIVVK